mmetsp:Transcript_111301/g.314177  ORF Transcript_111301/g.314177 Transcript_111301/m.314177 type:complete len:211 (+) Transcript_111301:244-876(+)
MRGQSNPAHERQDEYFSWQSCTGHPHAPMLGMYCCGAPQTLAATPFVLPAPGYFFGNQQSTENHWHMNVAKQRGMPGPSCMSTAHGGHKHFNSMLGGSRARPTSGMKPRIVLLISSSEPRIAAVIASWSWISEHLACLTSTESILACNSASSCLFSFLIIHQSRKGNTNARGGRNTTPTTKKTSKKIRFMRLAFRVFSAVRKASASVIMD